MKRLLERGGRIARETQKRRLTIIARELGELGISTAMDGSAVVLTGSNLVRRWLTDPALRFAGRIGR